MDCTIDSSINFEGLVGKYIMNVSDLPNHNDNMTFTIMGLPHILCYFCYMVNHRQVTQFIKIFTHKLPTKF